MLIVWDSLVAQQVNNLPALWETWVESLGWEDPLEKGMAILFWLGELHGQQSMGVAKCWTRISDFHRNIYITFCHESGSICISETVDISPSDLDSSLSCDSSSSVFLMIYSA